MAVVAGSVKLIAPGGGLDSLTDASLDLTWAARTDDPQDEADVVLSHSAVVKVGEQLTTTSGIVALWATKVSAKRDPEIHTKWIIKATYGQLKPQEWQTEKNPLQRPARIWWTFEDIELFLGYDRRGNWYRNPAGDYFRDPPPTLVTLSVLNIEKNLATFDPLDIVAAQNSVNLDDFLGIQPGYCKVGSLAPSEPKEEDSTTYYTLMTAIHCSPIPFHPWPIVNQGPRYLEGGELLQAADDAGIPSDRQILLAEDGTKLGAEDDPTVTEFFPFPEMLFADLAQLVGLVVTPS